MSSRPSLLLHHTGVHPALQRELAARGLELRQSKRAEDADRDTLACVVWFYDCLRHPLQIWSLRQKLKRLGVPLFAWNQDAPHYLNRAPWRLDLLDRFRLLDIYATHTLIDTRCFADTVLYFPNAADVTRYHLYGAEAEVLARLRDGRQYDYDVSFFGAMDGARYKEMRARQDFFAALGERLRAKGIRFLFREAAGMSVEEQVALIQKSRINLNFGASCDYAAPLASGLPERCYGIPAAGGFLLCDKRTHARDDFTPGENWAEFDGLDDCVAQIEHWLAHFAAARELAERCRAHVLARHTYVQRAATLHDTLLAWRGGRRGELR